MRAARGHTMERLVALFLKEGLSESEAVRKASELRRNLNTLDVADRRSIRRHQRIRALLAHPIMDPIF